MNFKIGIIVSVLVLIFVFNENVNAAGGGAGAFLRLGVGARAQGLGKAFSAIADDATANYYNPAGLSQIERNEVSFMLSNLSLDRKLSYLSAVVPYDNHCFGVSWLGFGIDDIEERDFNKTLTGMFDYGNSAYQISYGTRLTKKISTGLSFKYLTAKFSGLTYTNKGKANGYGFDVGLLYTPIKRMNIAFVVQDLWSKLDWKTGTKETIPNIIKLGVSNYLIEDKLLLSAELTRESFSEEYAFNAGVEWWVIKNFGIRLGSNDSHFSGGMSFKFESGNLGFALDYAYLEDTFSEELEQSGGHQISLSIKF
ncbi:MAG TPA: PorV/PorQ family protein [bacterium]|nr:PorV/PorQ family protein [bacterium]HOL47771.1 PorV/PorQ family protein [bacterium]HPQ18302.1 PorV/PorQ family protein [bacterium]